MKFTRLFGVAVTVAASVLGLSISAWADDLETIKAKGELTFASSGAYPPFSMVDNNNQLTGFDVDIGNEIAKRLGVKGVAVSTAWDGIIAGLLSNKFDTIVGSMTITPERQQVIDFVGPYYRAGRAIFVAEGSTIKSLDDLQGRTIGAVLGETHEKWASEQPGWTVRTYKGLPELFLELEAGRIQAFVTDDVPVLVAIKDNGAAIQQLDIGGAKDDIGIGIRKNNPDLYAAMQQALADMQTDGTYEAISMKWLGADLR